MRTEKPAVQRFQAVREFQEPVLPQRAKPAGRGRVAAWGAIFRKLLTLLKLGCRDSRYIECHLVPLALNYVVSHNLDRKTHKGLHVGRFRATLGFGGIHVGDPGLE